MPSPCCLSDYSIDVNGQVTCNSCDSPLKLVSDQNACSQDPCPTSYFWDATLNSCTRCHAYCQECTSSAICTLCKTTYFLDASTGTCLEKCNQNASSFGAASGNQCQASDTDTACSAAAGDQCTACNTALSYYLFNNWCIKTACPDGYFLASAPEECQACDGACKTCVSSAANC